MYNSNKNKIKMALWQRIEKVGECWLWTGKRNNGPYPGNDSYSFTPCVMVDKKYKSTRRVIWEICGGKLFKSFNIRAKCGTELCVRPSHLTDRPPSTWGKVEFPIKSELPISDEETLTINF